MADNQPTSTTPIRPSQILDPYPERVTSTTGDRLHTQTTPALTWNEPSALPARAHHPFTASFQAAQLLTRRLRLPIAATLLNVLGQAVLGASIAIGTVDPVIGVLAAVSWMLCGLALINAQRISIARNR